MAVAVMSCFCSLAGESRTGLQKDNGQSEGKRIPMVGEATGGRYRILKDADLTETDAETVKTRTYLYAGLTPVSVTEDSQTLYFGTDLRGSVRTLTDRYGCVAASAGYNAFGVPLTPDVMQLCGLGYTGKPYDSETGLSNYGFRDYSPEQGRFTSVDPIRYGMNWYSYVSNDPMNYVDLLGLKQVVDDGLSQLPNGKYVADKSGDLKNKTTIVITRDSNDNGNNGSYYQSTMEVTYGDAVLSSVPVQSTADSDKIGTVEGVKDSTLATGEYTGTLLNKSGHYDDAISISGEGVSDSDILIHPNVYTALGETESYNSTGKPQSQGCIIATLDDFNTTIDTLHDLGFSGGSSDSTEAWQRGDTVKIEIKKGK